MATELLLHFDGTGGSTVITDSSLTPKTVTAYGNAYINAFVPKFGTGNLYLDGAGDYVEAAADAALAPGASWTIEAFIRAITFTGTDGLFYLGDIASNANRIFLQINGSPVGFTAYIETGGGVWTQYTVNVPSFVLNTWFHVALVKNGTLLELYFDGNRLFSWDTGMAATPTNNTVNVGRARVVGGTVYYFEGRVDEFRYVTDTAVYNGATYTIPGAPFDAAPTGQVIAGTMLTVVSVAGSNQATAGTLLTVTATGSVVAGTELEVVLPSGSSHASTLLTVTATGAATASTLLAVLGSGHTPNWTARCLIDGVDVSARLDGQASVSCEEGAARIASLTLLPASGVVAPLDYVGKAISLDYVLIIGGVEVPRRLFTGRIDTPRYDPDTTLLSLDCVDDLQNRVAKLDRSVIDGLVAGRYSAAVQGAILDNWDYAQALLSTVAASLDAGASGGMRVTPWELASTWATWGDADLLYQRSIVTNPQRSTLVNHVDIEFDYRYPRLRQRYTAVGWSGTYIDMAPNGFQYPVQQDIAGAAGGSGWIITFAAYWPAPAAIPYGSGGKFVFPRAGAIDMAVLKLTQRHSQTVTEKYSLTVSAPESVAANGTLPQALRGALESGFDGQAWESALDVAPLMPTGGEQDYAPDAPRSASDEAIQTLLDQARVKILASHRSARLTNAVLCNPDLDLDKKVAISGGGMNAAGKVVSVTHTLDFAAGSAISEFSIACFGVGGSGIITPTTLAPPAAPAAAAETQDWPSSVPGLFVCTYGVTPYAEGLMGLLLNPSESITVETSPGVGTESLPNPFYVAGSYPVTGFRVQMPGVSDADRNPLEKPVAQSYAIVIPSDALTFTVP